MSEKISYIFWKPTIDVDSLWWWIFSISQSIAKRMHLLLSLVEETRTPNKKSWYVRIVRPRTVKRAMLWIDKRCGRLEQKIQELRQNPKKFQTIIEITIKLIMVKIEHQRAEVPVPEERVKVIVSTTPENCEIWAIIALLENFWFTRKEIFETIRWDTAKKIPKIEFDDVYKFLRKITQNPL